MPILAARGALPPPLPVVLPATALALFVVLASALPLDQRTPGGDAS